MAIIRVKVTKSHLKYTNNDCEFHFVGVEVIQVIRCSKPFRIKTEGINTINLFMCILVLVWMTIAGSKHIERNREEFVIDPSAVEGEDTHHKHKESYLVKCRHHFFG